MNGFWNLFAVAAAAGITTVALRVFPFVVLGRGGRRPKIIEYLGRVLTPASILMLVVYCLGGYYKNGLPPNTVRALAPAIATVFVIFMQWTVRKSLLSVFAGTILYMFLVQYCSTLGY